MSEQQTELGNGETGSIEAGPAASVLTEAPSEAVVAPAPAPAVDSPALVPAHNAALDPSGIETKASHPTGPAQMEPSKAEPHRADKTADASGAEGPQSTGKIMIMSSRDRSWDGKAWNGKAWDGKVWDDKADGAEAEARLGSGMFGKRRRSALAAVVVLAVMAGALGGALATAGLGHVFGDDATTAGNRALEASVARIDADIQALKASVEHTAKLGMSQFNKTSDRLDKVEKAQLEPAAKLARLSEAVDKLRPAAPAASAPVAAAQASAKDVTGSIAPPAASAAATPPKLEPGRLPMVEGWVLRDVADGGALIESRRGIFEVYPGDLVPGLGHIDAVRRQDGHWVVVTSKGLIAAR